MTEESRSGRTNLALLFSALGLVTLLGSLNQTLFAPALPTLVADLDGLEQMPWVIAAYMLGSIPTMPVFGKLSDIFGRKPLILISVLLFTAGSAMGGLAPSMGWLIAGRVLQGIGSGGLVILPQAAVADVVPARRRGFYVGILGGVFTVSSLIGPYLGGLLTEGPGWRWTFGINVILGIVAAIGVQLLLKLRRPTREKRVQIDYGGMALLSIATISLAFVTLWGGTTYPWGSPLIVGIIVIGLVATGAFVFVESRVPSPLMPPRLFKDRNFVLTSIASICFGIAMFSVVGYLPTYFQMTTGATPAQAGLLMIPMSAASLIGSTLSGWLIARTGRYKVFPIVGAALVAVGMALLATMTAATPPWWPALAITFIGFGLGNSFQNLILIVQNSFPHALVGTATAGSSLFRQIGGMFGTTLVGSLFIAGLTPRLSAALSSSPDAEAGASPSPQFVHELPEAIRALVVDAYNDSLTPVYLLMVPIAVLAAVTLCFVREKPLAESIE